MSFKAVVIVLLALLPTWFALDAPGVRVNHGATRGRGEVRSLAKSTSLWKSTSVCLASTVKGSRVYKTRRMIYGIWRLVEALGISNGVMGDCDAVCPCGEQGTCTALPGDTMVGTKEVASSYQCDCPDGLSFDGSSCSSTGTGPESCGGFAGTACSDKTYTCIDDPSDDCDPNNGGADCIGICVPSCAGFTAAPQPGCPDGTVCVDNPDTPDCSIAADCPGVCLPPPGCSIADGTGCWEGYSCTIDPNCDSQSDCPGQCVPSCAGFTPYSSQPPCPSGTFCVDNPATPDCLIAADCTGVCLPPPTCNLETGEGCWEGFSCTINPNMACEECPGICAPTCAGFTEGPQPACPDGKTCKDNPATPDCLIAADCTGVCLPPPQCNLSSGEGCEDGYSCTYNPNVACILMVGAECPGMCAPSCAGGLADNVECPFGTFCVDNPATPDCLIAVDCTGVCLPPSQCDVTSGEGCPEGFSCTIDPAAAPCSDGAECLGVCAPTCAGGRANNIVCPTGTKCVDNPATPDCLIAADCTGVCVAPVA